MALYTTGNVSQSSDWMNGIGTSLFPDFEGPTIFPLFGGVQVSVIGTGFTYNPDTGTPLTGTITGLFDAPSENPTGQQVTGLSLNAATYYADLVSNSNPLAYVFSGDDTFEIGQNALAPANQPYTLNGYAGNNSLNEEGLITDGSAEIVILGPAGAELVDLQSGDTVGLQNFDSFAINASSGDVFAFLGAPQTGSTFTDPNGGAELKMFFSIPNARTALLDLSSDTLIGISSFEFHNTLAGTTGGAEIQLASGQFSVGGLSTSVEFDSSDASATNDGVDIVMTTASFDASHLNFTSAYSSHGALEIDGSASSSNLAITGASVLTGMYGGSGNDSIVAGSGGGYIHGSTGHDTINAGANGSALDYGSLTTPGIVAIYSGTSGTVNKGGANGTDQLTGFVNAIAGSSGSDVFYVNSDDTTVAGNGGFDYLIELSPSVGLRYGNDFTGINEIVLDGGLNSVDLTGDSGAAYVYGSGGKDQLLLGSGGGYLFGEGGLNFLDGGDNAVNVFEGGSGGTNIMGGGGGTATNYYYVTNSDTIEGDGAFNAMIELVAGVTVQLGSMQYQDVQEFVANSAANVATVAAGDTDFVYLYGGAGNDTLSTGSGGGYLIGEGGTNTLTGGGSLNVFVADNASGVDTMNGGTGSNVYIIDNHSIVHGAGTFNTVEELQANASLTLGSAALTGVQEVVFAGGTNSADFHTATSSVFLYGGSGNDTLFGGTGNDFLFGGLGANTFEFGQGWGKDTIEDWTAGTSNLIDLTALASLGVHAVTDLTQTISNGNDIITSSHTGTNNITLLGVGAPLSAGSFHFA